MLHKIIDDYDCKFKWIGGEGEWRFAQKKCTRFLGRHYKKKALKKEIMLNLALS